MSSREDRIEKMLSRDEIREALARYAGNAF